jgi:MORN repeat variant
MDFIEQLVSKYPEKDDYVFSSCSADWLLVLKKLKKPPNAILKKIVYNFDIVGTIQEFIPETITDEMRSDIKDRNYARFTTNALLVVDIINKFSNHLTKNCIYDGPCKNGQIIYSTNKSPNIYYFKNPEVAYYYELNKVENGLGKVWYNNGQLYIEWHENGQLERDTFGNNKKNGLWKEWYKNGKPKKEYTYKDGKEDGLCKEWYENGQLRVEYTYKDGKYNGLCRMWHVNGQLEVEYTYKNGWEVERVVHKLQT